jgi:hypothetical protein
VKTKETRKQTTPDRNTGEQLKKKIMKTKLRTIKVIGTFAIIGLINANAVAGNKEGVNPNAFTPKTELSVNQTGMNEDAIISALEELTALTTDAQIEKYAAKQISLSENATESDFLNFAELLTASGTDSEIEKYASKLLSIQKQRLSGK